MIDLTKARFYNEPWPHLIVKDIISDSNTLKILESNPEILNYIRDASDEYLRMELNAKQIYDMQDFPDEIENVLNALDNSDELLSLLHNKFSSILQNEYPYLEKEYFENFVKYEFKYGSYPANLPEEYHNKPFKDTHIDGRDKIYTGMIYFRQPEDTDTTSHLYLEKYDEAGNKIKEKKIAYTSNVAIFWPNVIQAWHRADGRDGPNPCGRRFINFVANGQYGIHDYMSINLKGEKEYGWKKVNKVPLNVMKGTN